MGLVGNGGHDAILVSSAGSAGVCGCASDMIQAGAAGAYGGAPDTSRAGTTGFGTTQAPNGGAPQINGGAPQISEGGTSGAIGGAPDVSRAGSTSGAAGTSGTVRAGAGGNGSAGVTNAGRATNLGVSGTAGSGCIPVKPPNCDDGNRCTTDTFDSNCACVHLAVPDGMSCNDQNSCTQNDVCSAGVCLGVARASAPQVVGRLPSFGHAPGLQTLVAFPREDRALFARAGRLTLVGLDGTQSKLLDDIAMGPLVTADSVGSMVWVSRPRTFLIPVLEHHLAIASVDRGIDLFDLSGDKLTPSERYGFGVGLWPIIAATGSGSRLFACTSYEIQAWSIDSTTFNPRPGMKVELPAGHRCLGLALAPDGKTLYVATAGGLTLVDVSATDGSLMFGPSAREGNMVVDVDARTGYVAVFEVRQATSGFGDVILLSADTLEPVATFAADLGPNGVVPVGFSLLDGDRMLLQTLGAETDGRALNNAAVLTLGAAPAELSRRVMFHASASPFRLPSFHTVARGSYAATEPMHQLVRIDPVSGSISPLSSPQQGSFERVRAGGPSTVLAYGPGSVHRVDIADPTAPRVVAGGPVSPLDLEWLRLDVTDLAAPAFLTISDSISGPVAGPLTTLLRMDDAGLPRVVGSIANDDAAGPWEAAGSSIFQLSGTGTADLRLRRFPTSSITSTSAQQLDPNLDQVLTTAFPAALDLRKASLFSFDVNSGDLVVVESRVNSSTSGSETPILSAFAANGSTFERRFSQTLAAGIVTRIAMVKGRSVLLVNQRLRVVDRDGTARSVADTDSTIAAIDDLLLLDEKKLVLAVSFSVPARSKGVVILRTDDFSESARYVTSDSVTSFAEVGDSLVFGAKSSLSIATPACPGNPSP